MSPALGNGFGNTCWTEGKLRNRSYVLLFMSLDRACAMS